MFQKITKRTSEETFNSEYGLSELNKDVTSNTAKQAQQKVSKQINTTTYKNSNIKVTLEFPETTDSKAEQEFISRLKEIYLRKIEIGAMQAEESALGYPPTKESLGIEPRVENKEQTKEDKNHEQQ